MLKIIAILFLHAILSIAGLKASDKYRTILVDNTAVKISLNNDGILIKAEQNSFDTIRIPLIRSGNLYMIEAQIDEMTGNFIVDLGAPYLVLNSTYFRDYEIDKNYYAATLYSQNDYVRRTKIKKLNIYGLNYSNFSADVTDLGEIENKRGIKILGLLGVSLFSDYVFDLNLADQQLLLYKTLDKKAIKTKQLIDFPFRLRKNVILLKAKANNEELTFSLDSGAERNILDNSLPESVYEGMRILKTVNITDANGAVTEGLLSFINTISLGSLKLGKMPTLILNLESMSRAYGNNIDGMLGYPFFALGRVIIDFKNERLMLYQFNMTEE
jgi:predicted aspartyl protease